MGEGSEARGGFAWLGRGRYHFSILEILVGGGFISVFSEKKV